MEAETLLSYLPTCEMTTCARCEESTLVTWHYEVLRLQHCKTCTGAASTNRANHVAQGAFSEQWVLPCSSTCSLGLGLRLCTAALCCCKQFHHQAWSAAKLQTVICREHMPNRALLHSCRMNRFRMQYVPAASHVQHCCIT